MMATFVPHASTHLRAVLGFTSSTHQRHAGGAGASLLSRDCTYAVNCKSRNGCFRVASCTVQKWSNILRGVLSGPACFPLNAELIFEGCFWLGHEDHESIFALCQLLHTKGKIQQMAACCCRRRRYLPRHAGNIPGPNTGDRCSSNLSSPNSPNHPTAPTAVLDHTI